MTTRTSSILCAWLLVLAVGISTTLIACGADAPAGSSGDADAVQIDTGGNDDTGADDTGPADIEVPIPDVEGSADANDTGIDVGPGDVTFCSSDDECTSELCYLPSSSPDLGVCTTLCSTDDNCPEDWSCVQDQNAGGDAVRICVPTDLCVDADQDGRGYGQGCIATDCDENDPRIYVGASEICDGADNDCDEQIDEDPIDENDDCSTGFLGVCAAGRTLCVEGLLECIADRAASDEICDGLDNNCDGTVDTDPAGAPLARSCYSGPAGTADVGVCAAGVATCAGGIFEGCEGAVTPSAEVCDGFDNDCDGMADEGDPGANAVCSTGLGGICDISTTVCVDGDLLCPPNNAGRIEVCDGVDNDCDSEIDEGNPGGGGGCGTGLLGVCAAGTRVCEVGTLLCNANTTGTPEICDGLDNDCDGTADEGNPGGGTNCETGALGVCGAGILQCGTAGVLCAPVATASAEICDGLDNDCDGEIDEDTDDAGLTCLTGVPGICSAGLTVCNAGIIECDALQMPVADTCDGLDNDCDGMTDEGNPGGNMMCETGAPGVCSAGLTECFSGGVRCVQTRAVAAEVCDGLDNDCDGTADEENPGGGLNCNSGQLGICAPGTTSCQSGAIACDANASPASEICNGLDDNCDGAPDDGNPGGGRPCSTGIPGICSAGTTLCAGGGVQCDQTVTAETEVCDGLDNDCDGATDEGNPGGGGACDTGQSGICSAGALTCTGGALACLRTTNPITEICDGIDNDCDGLIDESNPGGGLACSSGEAGLCGAGTTVCVDGSIDCTPNSDPVTEVCNGLDEDCDGTPDDGNPGGGLACSTGNPGICSAGTTLCSGGGIQCQQNLSPVPDVCDGLDNDCDGATDEGNPGGGGACDTGQSGVCAAGVRNCQSGGLTCVRTTAPSIEICDGIDNDCDGEIDEGNPGGGVNCATGQSGVCGAGTSVCSAGAIVCQRNVEPSADICDGLDNNCNGSTDEGNPGGGTVCSTGQQGVCSAGTTVCSAGAIACSRNTAPSADVCDGLDNNCNGSVDESNPGGGLNCSTGQQGVCSAGTTVCSAGSISCTRNTAPATDTCDGLDNDCDGTVDEANPGGGVNCSTGQSGVCSAGTTSCSAGALVCNRNIAPSSDTCDGLDNDCDGSVDEANPGGGLSCSTGQSGVCSAGTTVCSAGAIACTRNTAPSTDICDGLDNNCNGSTDEGNPGGGTNCSTGQLGVCSSGTTACSAGSLVCNRNTAPSSDVCDGVDNDCDGASDEGNPGGGASCPTGQPGICAAGTTSCTGGALACNRNTAPVSEICDAFDNDCDGSTNEQCPSGFRTNVFTYSPQWADADGGSFFASTCPSGYYAAGFYGRSASRVDAIGTRCSPMTMTTTTSTTPYTYALTRGTTTSGTSYGGGGGSPMTRDCAAGTFMIGLSGRAGDMMDQMQAICGRFSITGSPGSYTVTRTQTGTTSTAGGSGGSPFSYTCPNDGVVSYILGRSGSEIDNAYIRCVTLAPNLIP